MAIKIATVFIKRQVETELSIISSITVVDSEDQDLNLFGLEPSRLTPVHPGHPCIPAGSYDVILTKSPHLGYVCPEVLNVPGRSAIRWHIGNFPKDVLGCIAIGNSYTKDMVVNSHKAFGILMERLGRADKIKAVYTDPV